MGWSTLGDLRIYEGKLLGCSYNQSRVGLWVADISVNTTHCNIISTLHAKQIVCLFQLIAPYALGVVPKVSVPVESTFINGENHSLELKESDAKSNTKPMSESEIGTMSICM